MTTDAETRNDPPVSPVQDPPMTPVQKFGEAIADVKLRSTYESFP